MVLIDLEWLYNREDMDLGLLPAFSSDTTSRKEPPSSWPKAVALHEYQKPAVCPSNDAVTCRLCVRLLFTMLPLPQPAKVSEPLRGVFIQGTARSNPCLVVSRVQIAVQQGIPS